MDAASDAEQFCPGNERRARGFSSAPPNADARLIDLANFLDCFTETDVCILADIEPVTLSAWRRRGDGPLWIRVGNRVLYPRKSVSDWVGSRMKDPKVHAVAGKDLL